MKFSTLLMFTVLLANSGYSQIVPSNCTASDSIINLYQEDAQRLTLRNFFNDDNTYKDSVLIPTAYSDTILNALIAVYNAEALPAHDSVIVLNTIHSFPTPLMNGFYINADSSLLWMEQLKNGILPTGNLYIDGLIDDYDLSVTGYYEFGGLYDYHSVFFTSGDDNNAQALANLFLSETGVTDAHSEVVFGDGNNITSTINEDHVELIYSKGWGDCPSGCIYRRYWQFRVYYDCSVEFVSSFGSIMDDFFNNAVIAPNPFEDHITINNVKNSYTYMIYDIAGNVILKGSLDGYGIIETGTIAKGVYIIELEANENRKLVKLIKY